MSLSGQQRICMAVIIVGFIICLTGYVSPYWEYISLTEIGQSAKYDVGLIFECYETKVFIQSTSGCQVIDWDVANIDDDIYFKAVRVLMVASLFCGLISSLAGIIHCCGSATAATSVLNASLFAIMSGLTGIAGVVTFAVCTKKDNYTYPMISNGQLIVSKEWAFYLSASGAGLMTLVGILSALVPKQKQTYYSSTALENTQFSNKGYGRFY